MFVSIGWWIGNGCFISWKSFETYFASWKKPPAVAVVSIQGRSERPTTGSSVCHHLSRCTWEEIWYMLTYIYIYMYILIYNYDIMDMNMYKEIYENWDIVASFVWYAIFFEVLNSFSWCFFSREFVNPISVRLTTPSTPRGKGQRAHSGCRAW